MRLSHQMPCRLCRFTFALVLAWIWAGGTQRAVAQAPTPGATAERLYNALAAVRKDMPRDRFDLRAVAATVGKDPAAAHAWVRDHTAWVPYGGALRGPVGVLMDRQGSSLDRATLLAELLRINGRQVRLTQGELPEDAAQSLAKSLTYKPRQQPATPPAMKVDEAVKQYAEANQLNPAGLRQALTDIQTKSQRMVEDLVERSAAQSKLLGELVLADAPAAPPAADVLPLLRDHWWVQYQDGDQWIDLDPAAQDRKALTTAAKTVAWEPKAGAWPLESALCHEVDLSVVVECWLDGKLTRHTILKHTLRPMELIGQHIELRHVPMDWPRDFDLLTTPDPAARVKQLAAEQKRWMPMLLVGGKTYVEGAFGADGTIEPKANAVEMVKAGRSVGGAGEAAAGLLDADAPPPPAPPAGGQVLAEWIEYEIRAPGAKTVQIRREVFDLAGADLRQGNGPIPEPALDDAARLRRGLALLGQIELLPLVCQLPQSFVDDLTAERALAMRESVLKVYNAPTDAAAKEADVAVQNHQPLPSRLYDLAAGRHTLHPQQQAIVVDRINLFSHHQSLREDAQAGLVLSLGIDILYNEIGVLPGAPDARRVRLTQGVIDTNAETLLFDPEARKGNAADLLEREPDPDHWLVVRSASDPQWQSAGGMPELRARIDRELAAGYTVIVPRQQKADRLADASYWRIDPATGTALGINGTGRGASMIEYAFNFSIFFTACMIGAAAAGKAGGFLPGGGGNTSGNKRSGIVCALGALGFALAAPAITTTASLAKVIGAAAATGGGVGYAL